MYTSERPLQVKCLKAFLKAILDAGNYLQCHLTVNNHLVIPLTIQTPLILQDMMLPVVSLTHRQPSSYIGKWSVVHNRNEPNCLSRHIMMSYEQ